MNSSTFVPVEWETFAAKLGLTVPPTKHPGLTRPVAPITDASLRTLLTRQCQDGERTRHLLVLAGKLLAAGMPPALARELCHQWNVGNVEALDLDKVDRTFDSIFASDQRNHPERHLMAQKGLPLFDLSAGRIDDYLSTDPAPRRWLLKDLVVLGKAGAVVAPGGSSKSQWLLQLAVGVASGIPVADHWEVGETGSVLVFSAEDDHDEIHRRIKRVVTHLHLSGHQAQLVDLKKRLFIFPTIGHDTRLTKSQPSGEVGPTAVVDRIKAMADGLQDVKLIILDPASRFRGGEENSNEDATRFVEALETLAHATGATVLIAHHTNKVSYNPDGEPGQGASRGASALTDGLRWQMNLGRLSERQLSGVGASKDDGGGYVAATVTKTNYSAFPLPVILQKLEGGYLSAVNVAVAQKHAAMTAIAQVLQVVLRHDTISARCLEEDYGGVDGPLKLPKHEVRNVVKLAIDQGFLVGGNRKRLALTRLGQQLAATVPAPAEDARTGRQERPRKKS